MEQITKIEFLYGVRNRIKIFLDEEYAFTISKKWIERLNLIENKEVDRQDLYDSVFKYEKQRAMNSAVYYLSRSDHSKAEMQKYLERREYFPEIIDEVMSKIQDYGYINDQRYANHLVESGAKVKGKSKRAIKYQMKEKGLDENTIEDALQGFNDEDEKINAMKVAKKYYAKNLEKNEFKRKASAALARRGYAWDVVKEVIDELSRDDDFYQ